MQRSKPAQGGSTLLLMSGVNLGLAPLAALLAAIAFAPVAAAQSPEPQNPSAQSEPAAASDQAKPADSSASDAELTRPELTWRVENPFRFFNNPADTEVHRATYLALSPEDKANPILAAERALSAREPEGWSEQTYDKTCWDSSRNRFVCPNKKTNYMNPDNHAVVVDLKGVTDENVTCTWLTSPRGARNARGSSLKRPCKDPVRLVVPYPGGAKVTVEIGGTEVARTDIKVKDILIAAMGDSFGSGEGNPDIPVRFSRERSIDYGKAEKSPDLVGYPARVGPWKQIGDKDFVEGSARWNDTACRRSLYSHQLRTALQLAVEDPHRAVTYTGVACSGAEVTEGLFLRYKGNEWVPNPPDLSQISALSSAQCGAHDAPAKDYPEAFHIGGVVKEFVGGLVLNRCEQEDSRKIDLLLVSIGGNDVGFARLVANAVFTDQSLVRKLGGWFGQVQDNAAADVLLASVDERYKALNRAVHGILHMPWEESDRVILIAYPPLALLGDGRKVCPDSNAGMDVFSEFSLSQKAAGESSTLADHLQKVMSQSARKFGWSFADAHRRQFIGRGLCAGFTENAFSNADDLRLPRKVDGKWEPFNPADYQPYATRQRWFRTPNDAFLTGNFHVSGSVLQKALKLQSLSWFQVLLASTYSGAFHPNAEGQAAMADAAVIKARDVLKKYGQQSEAAVTP